jgi:hypothetical protein
MPKASVKNLECRRWAEHEFGGARLGDRRLSEGLTTIAATFAAEPSASIPKACGSWAQTKATYRFFSNPNLSSAALLETHQQRTRERCQRQSVVLVVQDTTALVYGEREGLGFVSSGPEASKGLLLHSSLAFTPNGQPLGLMRVDTWTRDPAQFGKAALRAQRPIDKKESQRWLDSFGDCVQWAARCPGTRWINIADREADIYQLFLAAEPHPEVGVLVRARHNRRTMAGAEMDGLLRGVSPAGKVGISVPRKHTKASRQAALEVRFMAMNAKAPKKSGLKGSLKLWVVEAREVSERADALHWRLITNLPVETLESALEKIRWYKVRWQIEEYHRVLKSGCQAQGRQLETGPRLARVLMVDLVVAWRVLAMSRQARQNPEGDAGECFTTEELSMIKSYRSEHLRRKNGPITLQEAVRTVAQMGGFLARKSDGQPGAMTLWRGLERLSSLVEGSRLAKTYG